MKSKVFYSNPWSLQDELDRWLAEQSFDIQIISMTQSECKDYVVLTILYRD